MPTSAAPYVRISKAIHTPTQQFSMEGRRFASYNETNTHGEVVDLRSFDIHLGEMKKQRSEVIKFYQFYEQASDFRRAMRFLVETDAFSNGIMAVILINTLLLILSTWREIDLVVSYHFSVVDAMFLAIYVIEAALKIFVYRSEFFIGFNLLDIFIVLMSLVDMYMPLFSLGGGGATAVFRVLRVLRALRSLRVLRTIRFLDNIQVILVTCMQSFKSLGAIVLLMFVCLIVCGVIGRGFFAELLPDKFGSISSSFFTLIQLLTLDDWFYLFTGVTDQTGGFDGWMFVYLMIYIVLEYFVFLNLFVAVLVDNFQLSLRDKMVRLSEDQKKQEQEKEELREKMRTTGNVDGSDDDSLSDAEDTDLERLKKQLFAQDLEALKDQFDEEFYDEFDAAEDLAETMADKSQSEYKWMKQYFMILPALEKHFHELHNMHACHDRIIDTVFDTTDDIDESSIH